MNQDATTFLQKEHDKVRKLLGDLAKTTDRAQAKRTGLLEQIGKAVRAHAQIEEEIFYPAFKDAAEKKEDEKIYFEATEEHRVATQELEALEECDTADPLFGARAKVLKDLIEHHAEEEEKQMFPRAKKLLDKEELTELGERLKERNDELMAQATRAPRPARAAAMRASSRDV